MTTVNLPRLQREFTKGNARRKMTLRTIRSILFATLTLSAASANAQWLSRTVTSVSGDFDNLQPHFGFEVGEGTSHVEWGQAVPGSFKSYLNFEGYDAIPGFQQDWFYGGHAVAPGGYFRAGDITFRNGTVEPNSSTEQLRVCPNACIRFLGPI